MIKFALRHLLAIFFVLNVVLGIIFYIDGSFPTVLMMIHIFMVIVLWLWVLVRLKIVDLALKHWDECLLIIALVTTSLFIGLYKVNEITPGIYGDEVTVGRKSLELLQKPGIPPFDGVYSHPTPLMYMTAGSVHLFGRNKTALRLPSIVFAALAVGAFYIMLRRFFPIKIAAAGALLLVFQYTAVVLARLAYEPPASLFFQIVTLIFLSLYYKQKEKIFLVGTALSLGAGLYTYLNFRAFAALIFVLISLWLLRSHKKIFWQEMTTICVTLFIALMPLISYSFIDPHGFWLRSNEISIFSRHYSPTEFLKELGGNAYRIILFPAIGDPNVGKNPSNVPLFDLLTVGLAVIGSIYLFRYNRQVFWISVLLLIPPFISDVFSTEVIPEFHYYGLGHPNALRVSGLIPVVLFANTAALMWIYSRWGKRYPAETTMSIATVAVLVCCINYVLYFNQKAIAPTFYAYNYEVNHQDYMDLIDYLTVSPAQKISMTRPIAEFEHVPFFLHDVKKIDSFDLTSTTSAEKIIEQSEVTAIDISDSTALVTQELINIYSPPNKHINVMVIQEPLFRNPKIVVFEKQ